MHRLTLPGWAASVLLALASAPANAQPTAIVINEINYNSGDDAPSDDWVELHNPTAVAVDLSGWSFADESGRPFAMPPNTSIPARGFLVLAENTADFKLVYPEVTVLVGDFGAGDAGFGLSGGGEKLTLTDAAGAVIDEVTYADQAPWPAAADGGGPTLQLRDPALDNALAASWDAIPATPGAVNGNATSTADVERGVGLGLSPNPVGEVLRVTLNTGVDLVAIRVLDLAGRVLRSLPGGSATRYELSVGDLAAGVYLVELRLAGGARVAQRVAVVR